MVFSRKKQISFLFLTFAFVGASYAGQNSDDDVVLPISSKILRPKLNFEASIIESATAAALLYETVKTPAQIVAVNKLQAKLEKVKGLLTESDKVAQLRDLNVEIGKLRIRAKETKHARDLANLEEMEAKMKKLARRDTVTDQFKSLRLREAEDALKDTKTLLEAEKSAKAVRALSIVGEIGLLLDGAARLEETVRKGRGDRTRSLSAVPLISETNHALKVVGESFNYGKPATSGSSR